MKAEEIARKVNANCWCYRLDGVCPACQTIADALRAHANEALERCAKVVCRFCAMDWPVEDRPGWGFYHFNANGGPDQKCEAAAIRSLEEE